MKRPIDRISRGGSPGFTRLSYGRQRRRGLTARGALAAVVALVLVAALVLWLGPATVLSAITSTAGSAWSSMFGPGRPTATPTALSTPTPPADPTPTGGPSPTASPTIPGGLSKWPAENSAPVLYTTELSQYQGRAFDDQALKGVVVVLDPGHGSTPGGLQESGAVIGDMQESTINLQVADVLKAVLESHGATVVMTRNPLADEFRSLHYRIALTAQTVFAKQKAFWTRTGTTGDAALLDGLAALFQPSLTNNTDAYSTGRSIFKGLGASADLRTLLDLERQHGDMVFLSLHCNILRSIRRRTAFRCTTRPTLPCTRTRAPRRPTRP